MLDSPAQPAPLIFETAAEHLSHRVPLASPDDLAGAVRQSMAGQAFDTAVAVAVCEAGRLAGLLSLEKLLAAPDNARIGDLMDADPPIVAPGLDQEQAAWKAVRHAEGVLAVVDAEGCFLGLIPPHRLLSVLLWEHDEDMARMGGFLHDMSAARTATQEPVARRLWHRLPWLLMGLGGALVSADIIGVFEQQLNDRVMLAFFVPGVVYLADAVGTQTETLMIRGLSAGVSIKSVLWRELLTGLLVGIALALAYYPLAVWRWGAPDVALAASFSVMAACATATTVAMLLPWLLSHLGRDPAYGSGPLATVIQDLLSILIYFLVASVLAP
jgi:magnesium transporter